MSRLSARSVVNRAAFDDHVEIRRLLPEHWQKNCQENSKYSSRHRAVQNERAAARVKKRKRKFRFTETDSLKGCYIS
jgi:hypothetical protein